MPSYEPAKKNVAFVMLLGLPSQANMALMQANPTLATGDVKVSIDGGAFVNVATLPTVTPAGGKLVQLSLAASEMNGDNIAVLFSDVAGGEWCDTIVNITTSVRQIDDLATQASIDAFSLSGSIASAGSLLAATDVDVFNLAMDILKNSPIATATDDVPEAKWFLRNYIIARNAELREHPWKFAIKRRQLFATDFILDGITATLTGAWAPFRLTQRWMGDLLTVRRSSDSTTDDFGLATTTAGIATTVSDEIALDIAAVAAFVGSGSGYVSELYDQSGNGNHLAQATTTKQPLYVAELGDNARVSLAFDGTDDLLASSVAMSALMSVSAGYMIVAGLIDAATLDSATKTSNHLLAGDASSKLGLYVRKGGTLYGINDSGAVDAGTGAVRLYVPFVAELRHESGVIYARVNGEAEASATSGDTSSVAGAFNIGDVAGGSHALDFNLFAAMTFSQVPTLAERDRIVSRLMRYAAAPGFKDFDWAYRYPLPADCLRMLQLRDGGVFEGRLIKHEIEQGYILTDQSGPLPVRYIQAFTDASRFDPLFTETLAARLAVKLAHWLTGKANMVQIATDAYNRAFERAKMADSLESTDERPEDSEILDQRFDADGVR